MTVVHMRQPTLAAAKKKVAEFAFMSAAMSSSLHEGNCVYRKLKPGRSDGEARRGWGVNESFGSDESDEKSAHPCTKTDAF